MKKIILIYLLLLSFSIIGQDKPVNNYKYIIVSEKFDFFKEPNKYQTSSLTKFLLKKKGFQVFLSTEKFPDELNKDRCLALIAKVTDNSGFLRTKSQIELRDCFDKVVYTSGEGSSKIKQFKRAYQDAIKKAFSTMTDIKYSGYILKEVINKEKISKQINPKKNEVKSIIKKDTTKKEKVVKVLYAQPKENGYQLVNTIPKVVFIILKTKTKDVFIIKGKNGALYKRKDIWIAEYYKNDKLIVEKYKIKF